MTSLLRAHNNHCDHGNSHAHGAVSQAAIIATAMITEERHDNVMGQCKELCLSNFVSCPAAGQVIMEVSDKIGAALAEKVKSLLQDPKKRQMIFKFLGQGYVQKYFSDYPNEPSLLCSPNITDAEYEKIEKNIQVWLLDQFAEAAEQTGCQLSSDGSFSEPSNEMTHFVNHTCNLVEREIELLLATNEVKEKENSARTNHMLAWKSLLTRRPKSVESKDLHFTLDQNAEFQFKEKGTELTPPALNCTGSDVLSDVVCTIISSDYEHMSAVCDRLGGKLLPQRLRQFIWRDKLLKSDKVYKGGNIKMIEIEARKKYGKTLEHKLAEFKLRSATRSPISGLIENAVVEVSEKNNHMHDINCEGVAFLQFL
ncbi:uncharacterized protein LOC128652459 [Bombina bombina]|uniref:uncharacterized protein LOC128652459 n=1 Tax=Bombina bombina TaxID=8345 RepID=UPI00235A9B6F|nr:uncharacterized protein LOC128652459 [Bombina bombina]